MGEAFESLLRRRDGGLRRVVPVRLAPLAALAVSLGALIFAAPANASVPTPDARPAGTNALPRPDPKPAPGSHEALSPPAVTREPAVEAQPSNPTEATRPRSEPAASKRDRSSAGPAKKKDSLARKTRVPLREAGVVLTQGRLPTTGTLVQTLVEGMAAEPAAEPARSPGRLALLLAALGLSLLVAGSSTFLATLLRRVRAAGAS